MTHQTLEKKTYDSYVSFYQDVYQHVVREIRPAGRTGTTMILAEQDAGDWSDAPTPDLVISHAMYCGSPSMMDLGAGRFHGPRISHGGFICIPPGVATKIQVEGPHKIRGVAIPYKELLALVGEEARLPEDGDFGALHRTMHWDADTVNLLDRLWTETRHGSPYGALWADGALLQLVAHLLRLRDGRQQTARGGLTFSQLKRVSDFLAGNLDRDVGLAELSAICEISPSHFSRAYKQSTGQAPVQALIALRMERARALLTDPQLPVIEVAAHCGYDSPSAFARLFRRATGVTPTEWRRQVQS